MATLSSQLVLSLRDRVSGPARGVGRSLSRMMRDVNGFQAGQARMAGAIGGTLRNLALLGGAAIGAGVGLGSAVRSAMDWEGALADIQKTTGLSGAALDAMGRSLTGLSNKMPLSRTELAGLVAQAATFGVATEYLDEFALTAARASVAFDMTASDTAEGLSVMMNAFGLNVQQLEELTDQVNYVGDKVGGTEAGLMDFLARTGPTAVAYGIGPETLLAYGGGLMGLGISAERASTGVNAIMTKLSGLTENDDAVAMLDAIGGRGYSSRLQRKFYEAPVEAMNELFEMSKGMNAEQRAGFFTTFFGLEYGDDAAAIVAALDTIMEAQEALSDSTNYLGGVQSAYDIFAATTANRLKVLGNNLTNIGAAFGANLLGPIVTFSDRLVGVLGTLDQRVTVFDRLASGVRGFFDGLQEGLGLDAGDFGRFFELGWAAIFGDLDTFEEDTDTLTRIFMSMREWGAAVGDALSEIGAFFSALWDGVVAVEAFVGAEPGTAADLLQTMATSGLALAGVGLILSTTGRGIGVLARALFYLSGASALLGGARGIAALFGAIGAGNALAGAGGADLDRDRARRPGRGGAVAALALRAAAVPWATAQATGSAGGRTDSEATQSRIADARAIARGEALRAQTLATVAPMQRNFDATTSALERLRGGAAAAEEEADLGDTLDVVGSMTVRPYIDTTDIAAASRMAGQLESYLNRIDAGSRTLGPVGGPVTGARASGGPVGPGTWLVGEQGPELLSLRNRGHVLDAERTRRIMGRGDAGGRAAPTINVGPIHITGAGRDLTAEDISREIARTVEVAMRSAYSDAM